MPGSCNRAGTLTFHGMIDDVSRDATADENGNFVARFTVPRGTFPGVYTLELTVDCNRQLQWVRTELTVINPVPVAVDDSAATTQDTPVAIAVAANDRNPDPASGYPTVVVEHRSPLHGTIQVRPDRTIVYTPETGFLGRDQFQYSLCDDIINAAGQADCGTATVTVMGQSKHPDHHRRAAHRRAPYRRAPYRRAPYRRAPYRRAPYRRAAHHYEPALRAFGGRHPELQGDARQGGRRSRAPHHGEGRPRPRAMPAQGPAGRVPPRP
jgi:hypothetical protein